MKRNKSTRSRRSQTGGDGNKGRRSSPRKNKAKLGDWNLISDRSGQKIKASESMKTWQGWIVHKNEWEPRQPQRDVRGRDENIAVPESRPRGPTKFFVPTRDDL